MAITYLFSIAAITNYHTFRGLKTTQIYYLIVLEIRSPKWVSLGKNQAVGRAVFLLEAVGGNLFLCLFQPLEATHIL